MLTLPPAMVLDDLLPSDYRMHEERRAGVKTKETMDRAVVAYSVLVSNACWRDRCLWVPLYGIYRGTPSILGDARAAATSKSDKFFEKEPCQCTKHGIPARDSPPRCVRPSAALGISS